MKQCYPARAYILLSSFLVIHFLVSPVSHAQTSTKKIVPVQFISKTPVIDGELDKEFSYLSKRTFNHFWQFDNPVTDTVKMNYRLGYTPTHFYIYIEAEADSIIYRDRGFINGDGFKLLFAIPQTDSGSNEYYDIVFSPSKDKKYWARKRIWDYNRKQDHGKKLSTATQFEEKALNGRCGFEALIAWEDIEPYHPWFLNEMGYNLYFAKGIGKDITNGYAETTDEGIWDEEVPLRQYTLMQFEKPQPATGVIVLAKPKRRNLSAGAPIIVQTVTTGEQGEKEKIHIVLKKDSVTTLLEKNALVHAGTTLRYDSFLLQTKGIPPGTYKLEITAGATVSGYSISILPVIAFKTTSQEITANKNKLSLGVVNTLQFKLNQLQEKIAALRRYETGEDVLAHWSNFQQEYNTFLAGKDPYRDMAGAYRRAFKSIYDGSYQPYTIKLPTNYDPAKKYPLLVFLHGSGQDERNLLKEARSDGSFIELAPFARDMYRCYSSDSSQNDIIEAMRDVRQHFSVDTSRIVVGGFSMGGYGALRTYAEHPSMYKAVAVFAGHPSLATEWLGEGHPDFVQEKYLKMFSGIPVFVYHGRKDGALPVEQAELLIEKLKQYGAVVTGRLIDTKAHEYPDEETNLLYFKWLKKAVE